MFEVIERDGPARIGAMGKLTTPAVLELGNLEMNFEAVELVPFKGQKFSLSHQILGERKEGSLSSKKGIVVNPFPFSRSEIPKLPGELYILAYALSLFSNPRRFVSTLPQIRGEIPYNSPLYMPCSATPENVPLLIYMGMDLVDDVYVRFASASGEYLTSEGSFRLESIKAPGCTCPTCMRYSIKELQELDIKERTDILFEHNTFVLENEISKVRLYIGEGRLREYVESSVRSSPTLTTMLRLLDSEYEFLEQRTPLARKVQMYANTHESLNRVEVRRFIERAGRFRSKKDALLILPCSKTKPYSFSPSHRKVFRVLGKARRNLQELMLTSPLGVVPRELELVYPAAHYDIPVTGRWYREEVDIIVSALTGYLENNTHEEVLVHVSPGYREICERAEEESGVDFEYIDGPVNLVFLAERLSSYLEERDRDEYRVKGSRRMRHPASVDVVRAMAVFQFGQEIAKKVLDGVDRVEGRYPRLQAMREERPIATVVPEYGILSLTLEGAAPLLEAYRFTVKIDDFIPKGSILAPGVVEADPEIRVMDEVAFSNDRVVGVGKARMSGPEMMNASRGIAVDVRHKKEIS